MQKVKLPREVAEAIESLSKKWGIKAFFQAEYMRAPNAHAEVAVINNYFKPFETDDSEGFDKLVAAMYEGYEVEMTAEERIKERHDMWAEEAYDRNHNVTESLYRIEGMKITLILLGITIPGVNDHE